MARRMLIDASHPEETRVVIVSGNRLEEFDYETASKQQIKGNIYLAKVTRVEPSLQAAFVDYGGNRHGFLAFNEIHPDYYRIPVADREKLFGSDSDGDYPVEAGESPAERALADADGEAVTIEATPDGREDGAEDEGGERVDVRDRRGDDDERNVETVGGDEDEDIDRERRRLRMLRNYRIQEVIKRRQIMLVQVTKEERGNKGAALTTYLSLAGRYCVLMPNTARGGGVSRKISNPADRKRLRAILDEFEIPHGMAVIVRTAGSERSRAEIRRDYEYLMRLWEQIRQTTLESVSPALIHEEGNLIKRSIRDLYSRDIDEVIVDGEASYRTAKDFMRMLMPSHAARVKRYKEDVVPLFQQYQVESQLDEIHSNTVRLKSGGYLVINPTEALVSIDVNSGRATRERHIEETALKTNLEAAQEVSRQLRLRDLAGLIVIDFIDMEESRNNTAVERKLKESLRGDRARIQLGRISAFGLLEMSRQRLRPSIIEASSQICPHCKGAGHIRSTESSALQALRGIEEEGLSRRSAAVQLYVPTGIALYLLNQKRGAIIASEQRYSFSVSVATDDTLIAPDFHIERLVERSAAEISQLRGADLAARAADDEQDEQVDEEDLVHEEEDVAAEPAEQDEARAAADGDDGKGRPRRRRSRRRRGRREDGTEAPAGEELQADGDYPDAGSEEPRSIAAESAGSVEDGGESDERDSDSEAGADARTGEDGGPAAKSRRGRRGGRRRRRRDDGPEDSQPLAADGAAAPIDADAHFTRSSDDRGAEAAREDHDIVPEAQDEPGREASPESAPPESAPPESPPEAPGEVVAEPIAARAVAEPDPDEEPAPRQEPRAKAEPAAESGNGRAPAEEEATAALAVDSVDEDAPEEPVEDREPVHAESGPPTRGDRDDRHAGARREQQPRRGWWQRLIEG